MQNNLLLTLSARWKAWWKRLSPSRQDRYALLAPIAAVAVFLLTIVSSVGYLRIEEMEREQESVQRDLEFANQKMRLHLLEQQEQMLRLARDVSNDKLTAIDFAHSALDLAKQYPEVASISWIDSNRHVRSNHSSGAVELLQFHRQGAWIEHPQTEDTFLLAKELRRSIYSTPIIFKNTEGTGPGEAHLQLHIPMQTNNDFKGVVLIEAMTASSSPSGPEPTFIAIVMRLPKRRGFSS